MRARMEVLVTTFLPALPGATRLGVVDALAQDTLRAAVWGFDEAQWASVIQELKVCVRWYS